MLSTFIHPSRVSSRVGPVLQKRALHHQTMHAWNVFSKFSAAPKSVYQPSLAHQHPTIYGGDALVCYDNRLTDQDDINSYLDSHACVGTLSFAHKIAEGPNEGKTVAVTANHVVEDANAFFLWYGEAAFIGDEMGLNVQPVAIWREIDLSILAQDAAHDCAVLEVGSRKERVMCDWVRWIGRICVDPTNMPELHIQPGNKSLMEGFFSGVLSMTVKDHATYSDGTTELHFSPAFTDPRSGDSGAPHVGVIQQHVEDDASPAPLNAIHLGIEGAGLAYTCPVNAVQALMGYSRPTSLVVDPSCQTNRTVGERPNKPMKLRGVPARLVPEGTTIFPGSVADKFVELGARQQNVKKMKGIPFRLLPEGTTVLPGYIDQSKFWS